MQSTSTEILSDITVHMKYAMYRPDLQRRETWSEIVDRNKNMHIKKFPSLKDEIEDAYKFVYDKKVLPSMRALCDKTPIITKNGWKTVGEVVVGDILYASNGSETVVEEVIKFPNKELYKLTFSDNSELIACDEHLWIVATSDDILLNRTRVVDTKFIREHLTQAGKNNISIYNAKPIQREEKEYIVPPYIMGHWLGDGYSNGTQISTDVADSEHIVAMYDKYGFRTKHSDSTNIWTWSVYGLREKLKQCGVLNNKHLPQEYLYGSVDQRIELLQGFMDSDGCVDKTGRCMFHNTNLQIIESVRELLSSLGIKYIWHSVSPKTDKHQVGYCISFFTDLNVVTLPRKVKRLRKYKSHRTSIRKVFSVDSVGRGDATCFRVNSYDHSFLAGKHMIVTHNCLQFSGKAIEVNPVRSYNCSYAPVNDYRAFSETMFLLLSGTGVGFSCQKHHVDELPAIRKPDPKKTKRYLIGDSIEGWSDAIKALMKSYFFGGATIRFDFSDIRPKGARLITSGGKAPGPEPLRLCIEKIRALLNEVPDGEKLTPIQVHDVMCHIADAVLAGGIRRSAMISLFSADDHEMIACKSGDWWTLNPQRGRANNSAVLVRHKLEKEFFLDLWKRVQASGAGEPGIFMTNDKDAGTNPSLRAGTKVITRNGIFPIEQLQDSKFEVPNLRGEWSKAECWKSGTGIRLWKLKFDDGSEYYSSPEHKWPVFSNGRYLKCESQDLKVGDMMPINVFDRNVLFEGTLGNRDIGFLIGWLYGDGCLTCRTDNGKYVASFVASDKEEYIVDKLIKIINEIDGVEERKLSRRNGAIEFQVGNSKFADTIMNVYGADKKEYGLPKKLWTDWSDDMIRGFIDGYFSSDGHVAKDSHGISVSSCHKLLAYDMQTLLGFYGIKSTVSYHVTNSPTFPNGKNYDRQYECYRVRTTARGKSEFSKLFSLTHIDKQNRILEYRDVFNSSKKQVHMILKTIEQTDLYEDVWDISVDDDTHCFHLGTVTTGNCCEIGLRENQMCNLCEVNVSDVESQEDLNERVKAAAFIGTLQASYTDFHYLRPIWQKTCEREALLGVSMTGIASGKVLKLDVKQAAKIVQDENKRVADIIGINKSARLTTVKPAGTTSLVLGCSSGIHAWHNDYYIRRMRVGKNESIYTHLLIHHPELIEDEFFRPHDTAIITVPVKAPEGAIVRTETALDLLERTKWFHKNWIKPGHNRGANKHNVSVTVSVKENEWDEVGEWMWENRNDYTGISVLPFDGGSYTQSPFEDITEDQYNEMVKHLHGIDLTKVIELEDHTQLSGELACAGGACEII